MGGATPLAEVLNYVSRKGAEQQRVFATLCFLIVNVMYPPASGSYRLDLLSMTGSALTWHINNYL